MLKRLLLCLASIMSVSAQAEPLHIDHPGSLELTYFGPVDRPPPLAPLQKIKLSYKYFYVYPGVVVPSIQSAFLLENTSVNAGEEVLDIGTGSGVQAIFAAEKAKRVVATDLSEWAVENARFNVQGHNVGNIVTVRQGDLFGAVVPGDKFDVIINNIDYPYNAETQGLWEVHERFFREVSSYLKPQGRIFYQSGLIENIPHIQKLVQANGLRIMRMVMASAYRFNREPIVYLITRDPVVELQQRIERNKDKLDLQSKP